MNGTAIATGGNGGDGGFTGSASGIGGAAYATGSGAVALQGEKGLPG